MTWYWDALTGIGIFNLLFVLISWLLTVVRERTGLHIPEEYMSEEYFLHFLQTMYQAEKQET
jgi:hypothetical protein